MVDITVEPVRERSERARHSLRASVSLLYRDTGRPEGACPAEDVISWRHRVDIFAIVSERTHDAFESGMATSTPPMKFNELGRVTSRHTRVLKVSHVEKRD